jgi:hypothetical protein
MRKRKTTDKHHRKPRSLGGTNDPLNISVVPREKHEAWHLLFSNGTPDQIADIINQFWLDPDWFLVAVPRRMRGDYEPREEDPDGACCHCHHHHPGA